MFKKCRGCGKESILSDDEQKYLEKIMEFGVVPKTLDDSTIEYICPDCAEDEATIQELIGDDETGFDTRRDTALIKVGIDGEAVSSGKGHYDEHGEMWMELPWVRLESKMRTQNDTLGLNNPGARIGVPVEDWYPKSVHLIPSKEDICLS
jgi:hypothetical protein